MLDVQGTFISQKINKIRWLSEEYGLTAHFVTGSWDDVDCDSIKVWILDGLLQNEIIEYPRQLDEFKVDGDVTEIGFVARNQIAASTSDGDVRILSINTYDRRKSLKELFAWKSLHNYGRAQCSCTGLNILDGEMVTVGEDGAVNILSCGRGDIVRSIKGADSCTIYCVCYVKHNEVMTGNLRGHMKIWDIRQSQDKPTAAFLLSGDEQAATCLVRHPTQPHIILAGSESGSLAVWDLRMEGYPTSLINAHSGWVKEVQFHHENPHKLLTISRSGEFWEWNMDAMTQTTKGPDDKTTWLPHSDKSIVKVDAILPKTNKPLNTFSCEKSRILVGGDNEAVYALKKFKYI